MAVSGMPRPTSRVTLTVAVCLALGWTLIGSPALADSHNPNNIDPCADAPEFNEFVDRGDAREAHRRSIDCVLYRAIAEGYSDAKGDPIYYPLRELTRAQMASFVAQTLDAGGYGEDLPSGTGPDEFEDIADSVHRRNINRLAKAGIIRGTSRREFSVAPSVTRQQMASFIVQAAEFALGREVDGDGRDRFTDVADGNVHKANIEAGADVQPTLFRGFSEDRFRPGQRVLRDQMASFLVNLLTYIFDPERAPRPVAVSLDQTSLRVGQTLTGSVVGDDVTSASVAGDCVEDASLSDTNGSTGGIQYAIDIAVDAQPGACGLVFSVTQAVGESQVIKQRGASLTIVERPPKQQTDAPELVSAEFVRETTNQGSVPSTVDDFQQTTVRFTFDEDVTETLDLAGLHLVTFDGRRFTAQQASRESGGRVLAVFGTAGAPMDADEFADVTVATADVGAVRDAAGQRSPEGNAAVNTVILRSSVTQAPDLRVADNFRPGAGTPPTTTLVDLVFDQPAYVVSSTGFELVLVDNTEIACSASPAQGGGFQGDGTDIITVACSTAANADQQIPPEDMSRAVVQAGAVSDSAQDSVPGTDGTTNPLAVSDVPHVVSTAPDIDSVELHAGNTATFTFDQEVAFVGDDAAATAARFRLYDNHGVAVSGTQVQAQDPNMPDTTVVVSFPAGAVDAAVGGAVQQEAVTGVNRNPQTNQEDEEGVLNPALYPGGFTVAPDLLDVERAVTGTSTDPITGEVTQNEVTFTFAFDEEVATASSGFVLYSAESARVTLTRCTRSGAAGPEDDDEVLCVVSRRGGGADVNADGSDDLAEGFAAAQSAVLGTVNDGAVADSESDANHEAALAVIDA